MKTMNRKQGLWALSLAALVLAGCSSPVKLDDKGAPVESRTPSPVGATAGQGAGSGAGAGAVGQSQVASVDLGKNDASAPAMDRLVYFDFDSYVVKPEYRPLIDAHAKRLVGNRNLKVVVEGHTDERGGREYNLALGQRRAEAVQRSLTLLGVNEGQVEAVSFGKERPAVAGSTEEAWAKNRRAELKDR